MERRHDQWLRQWYPFASIEEETRFLCQRSALWTAVTYPSTEDERFHDLARLTSFLFCVDDLCLGRDEDGMQAVKTVLTDILAVMDGNQLTTAYGRALADIWADMRPRMPPGQRRRLIAAVLEFGRGLFTEMTCRADGAMFNFDRYVQVRTQQSLAAWIYFVLTEYAAEVDLDDEALDCLRPLHWTAAEHLLFVNDLFSFRAEHYAGDHMNAICVLAAEGASLQDAVDRVAGLVTAKEQVIADQRDRILASQVGSRGEVRSYLEKLEYVISGNLEQARFAPRYHGTASFVDCPIETGEITLWPDRTEYHPVGVFSPK